MLTAQIRKGSTSPVVASVAARALRQGGAVPRDYTGHARILHGWVQRNILYLHEGGERFTDAERVLFSGAGDCDCQVIALGSLLGSIRLDARPVVLRRNGRGYHVFAEVKLPPRSPVFRWVPAETSIPVPFGWDPRNAGPREIAAFL